jgi:hypothetical protein
MPRHPLHLDVPPKFRQCFIVTSLMVADGKAIAEEGLEVLREFCRRREKQAISSRNHLFSRTGIIDRANRETAARTIATIMSFPSIIRNPHRIFWFLNWVSKEFRCGTRRVQSTNKKPVNPSQRSHTWLGSAERRIKSTSTECKAVHCTMTAPRVLLIIVRIASSG